MRCLSSLLCLSLPPEMDEMAQNRMVCSVEMLGDRLVNIVPRGTKVLGKPARELSASFSDIKFGTFIA